ncbi:TPA: tRNA pseudouridine(55) synthase TruB [Candidatus Falkowbacteria bacterium]|nr:tRNA pseudouridine(55) synthase TruB [Candidatus Falkowbacteria bacterium]
MTQPLAGFLLINKSQGWTSFDIVAKLRRITGVKKIGHAGTLDPLASGLLIVAVGREATKRIDEFKAMEKDYEAELEFGKVSDTYDIDGNVLAFARIDRDDANPNPVSIETVSSALNSFLGVIEQMPPAFSAKKIGGTPAYKLARQGKVVELKPATIEIKQIEILKYAWPLLSLKVTCGAGTYIRSLIHDLGQKIGCGAIMTGLVRTRIGQYELMDAKNIDALTIDNWMDFMVV